MGKRKTKAELARLVSDLCGALTRTHARCMNRDRQLTILATHDIDRSLYLGALLSRPPFLLQLRPAGKLPIDLGPGKPQ